MDNVKSILFVLPSTAIGGAEIRFLNIMKGMRDVRSSVITHSVVAEYFSGHGIPTYLFDEYGCSEPMSFSFVKTLRYARGIADTAKKESVDGVIGIMHTGSFYASAAGDIFRLGLPNIGTILGNISAYFMSHKRRPSLLERALLWYLLRRPQRIIVPSQGVKDDLVKNLGAQGGKISVIYNGIDINNVREMAAQPLDAPDTYAGKTIITACRLNAQKDFITLLKAFKEVREKIDSRLIIVGDGELKDEIIGYTGKLGIKKDVIITGFQKNPFKFIGKADVFVLSSFFEGFSNVIVEAMALGIPVVAADCPSGPGEIIQDGVNGFLVPLRDYKKMAEVMMKLLTEEKTRNEISVNGIKRAESFKAETMIKEFEKIIVEMC